METRSGWRALRAQEGANPHELTGSWGKQEPSRFALPLCTPKSRREAIRRGGCRQKKYVKLHDGCCSADYPQTRLLCFGQPLLVGFKPNGVRKITKKNNPWYTGTEGGSRFLKAPPIRSRAQAAARAVSPPAASKQLHFATSGARSVDAAASPLLLHACTRHQLTPSPPCWVRMTDLNNRSNDS